MDTPFSHLSLTDAQFRFEELKPPVLNVDVRQAT
jgi:hypothetical protein